MNIDEMYVNRKKKFCLLHAIQLLTCIVFLLCTPLVSFSTDKYYTIAISSVKKVTPAKKQLDVVADKLHGITLDYLRVEKIGKFYSVRVGKYSESTSAKELLRTVKAVFPKAILLYTGIIDARIVKMYTPSIPATPMNKNISSAKPESKRSKLRVTKKHKIQDPDILLEGTGKDTGLPADKSYNTKMVNHSSTMDMEIVAAHIDNGDYELALKSLESEHDNYPDDPELNAWLGTVFIKKDEPLKALSHIDKAVTLSPERADYHNAMGYSQLLNERFVDAVASFRKAIDLDPLYVDAIAGLCIAHTKGGNKEEAMAAYNNLKDSNKKISDQLLILIQK